MFIEQSEYKKVCEKCQTAGSWVLHLFGEQRNQATAEGHGPTVGVTPWDVCCGMRKSGHRKVVQGREMAKSSTEAWVSKAGEDGIRETSLLQTVILRQNQVLLKPGVSKLLCKVGISSSSLTLELKEKCDCSVLKGGNQRESKNILANVKLCHQSWRRLKIYYLRWGHCGAWQDWGGDGAHERAPRPAVPAVDSWGHGPPHHLETWAGFKLTSNYLGVSNQTDSRARATKPRKSCLSWEEGKPKMSGNKKSWYLFELTIY